MRGRRRSGTRDRVRCAGERSGAQRVTERLEQGREHGAAVSRRAAPTAQDGGQHVQLLKLIIRFFPTKYILLSVRQDHNTFTLGRADGPPIA